MKILPRVEEIILLSIWRLRDRAYGMAIRKEVMRVTEEKWLLGAIYGPLGRLHRKGFVTTIKGDPIPKRGGRAKVYYKLTPEGIKALAKMKEINATIWKDVPKLDYVKQS